MGYWGGGAGIPAGCALGGDALPPLGCLQRPRVLGDDYTQNFFFFWGGFWVMFVDVISPFLLNQVTWISGLLLWRREQSMINSSIV